MTLSQYFICFMVYSFLGWVYESLFYSFQFRKPVNTGFLRGCICPIYGLACVANVVVFGNIKSNLTVFLLSMLMISSIEYIVSWMLENLFNKRWWDYSDWPLNLNGRISVISSLGFGALSLVQMRFIHPVVDVLIMRIPQRTVSALGVVFAAAIILDLLLTIKDIDKADDKLWFVEEESIAAQRANEKITETKKNITDRYSELKDRIMTYISR